MLCTLCYLALGAVGVAVFTFTLGWWKNGHFKRHGVKSPATYVPFIGHMMDTMRRRIHFKDFTQNVYQLYPEERYIGIIQFGSRIIFLKDLDLIRKVAIKDFDHFVDHLASQTEDSEDTLMFESNLFNLKGQKWRDMRATLSPAFTSSKMRGMFQFIVDCGEQMADHYIDQMKIPENKVRGLIELEMKDAYTRYTNDVIATSAFGLTVNSFTDKNNQFYMMGKEVTDFSGWKFFIIFFVMLLPRIAKLLQLLDVQFFSKKLCDFYRNLVWDTVKYREDNNVVRPDMIQLLMEARKGTLKRESNDDGKEAGFATVEESDVGKTNVKRVWKDDEIVAQALLFFIAGFDTSSTLLCFLTHEIAHHPEIQRKLQNEIDEVAVKGKLTHDSLQTMKYMDMVVSEALRMWPPLVATDRKCTKAYDLPPPNKNSNRKYTLNEGDGIMIPVYGLHHDPRYFKNPEVFDPERFSDENKDNIQPFTYLPFGVGPRNCIGSRFALMEVKAVIYNLLLKFDIVPTAKTQNPIKMKMDTFNMHSEKGFWLGLKPRAKHVTT